MAKFFNLVIGNDWHVYNFFQLIPAYYKEMLGNGSPETVAELNKHLTAFEKELNGKKFVGGGS